VLAAGASRRMGQPKQLLAVGGEALLERVAAAASASRLDEVVVVLGAGAEAVRRAVALGRARVVVNERHEQGMSTSLRAGIAALDATVERAVVILGDQPDVTPAVIDELLDRHQTTGLPAAALSAGGVLQPPVVLSRELWPELESMQGDVGARALLRSRPERVAVVTTDRPPADLDTPEDLARWRESQSTPPSATTS